MVISSTLRKLSVTFVDVRTGACDESDEEEESVAKSLCSAFTAEHGLDRESK
jgi:hypothetical protein